MSKIYKKIALLLFFCIISTYFSSGKPPYRNQIAFLYKPQLYTTKEIKDIERKYNFKFPKFAKKVYKQKIDIRDLIFTCKTCGIVLVETIDDIKNPTLDWNELLYYILGTVPFGYNQNSDIFLIGENCIWYKRSDCKEFHLFMVA